MWFLYGLIILSVSLVLFTAAHYMATEVVPKPPCFFRGRAEPGHRLSLPFSLDPDLYPLPKRVHPDDVGLGLCAAYTTTIKPNTVGVVDTGVRAAIPEGYVGFLFLRSGFASECPGVSLANGVGVIDAGYRGNIKVLLKNDWPAPMNIPKGARFVQLVIVPCFLGKLKFEDSLPWTQRGDCGFGSTGK